MKKVALVIDNSAQMSNEDLQKANVKKVVPISFIINGEEFLDGVSITPSKLSEEMKAGKVIKTSTPPPMVALLSRTASWFPAVRPANSRPSTRMMV